MRGASSEPIFQPLLEGDESGERTFRSARNLRKSVTAVVEQVKIHRKRIFVGGASVGVLFGILGLVGLIKVSPANSGFAEAICGERKFNYKDIQHYSDETNNLVAVNFGGWLCLEDWFFSGSVGRYVSTPGQLSRGQGACLPPLLSGPLDEPWPSEGVLINRLMKANSSQWAADVFKAHRESFIGKQDYKELKDLGIKSVRIPLSWAVFADVLAQVDPEIYGKHDPDHDTAIVPDPFYKDDIHQATVPRAWLRDQLALASDQGIRVVLDIPTMPGGSSDGTYSGIWPLPPKFWKENVKFGSGNVSLQQVGLWLNDALIKWVESLDDLLAKGTIWGLCMINEPAHLSAMEGHSWATEDDVLNYIESYTELFRASTLPKRGVRLYVQIIETAFSNFNARVPDWYHKTYTDEERGTWAVMARHYYTAWNNACNGLIQSPKVAGGGYQCDESTDRIRGMLRDCIFSFAGEFNQLFPSPDLRAVTEWSLGTNPDANMACTNADVLRVLFEANVNAFAILHEEGLGLIEPFFWTWRMPYGPKFQPGWSLKFFSGLAGQETLDSNGRCLVGEWAEEDPLAALSMSLAEVPNPGNSSFGSRSHLVPNLV
eukprot:CAMPEP_0170633464 /NCGR_PEP_ID=MMETSP0224-20130122/36006_1 /TAXON_ID=285029 /ORGANISM="Togula jolla, Strain CCCM 725" /LENGTH=600 /DNA_ID=CAMNT_0010962507 /DNA_START=50 /DNA_END=1852 /DNA_ORIENTATION=+